MSNQINFKPGQHIIYLNDEYIVKSVYPHMVYMYSVKKSDADAICVCLGDLVVGGAHPVVLADKSVKSK